MSNCETCGKQTQLPVHICGWCAEHWNREGGKAAIDSRRKTNGLPPLAGSQRMSGGLGHRRES